MTTPNQWFSPSIIRVAALKAIYDSVPTDYDAGNPFEDDESFTGFSAPAAPSSFASGWAWDAIPLDGGYYWRTKFAGEYPDDPWVGIENVETSVASDQSVSPKITVYNSRIEVRARVGRIATNGGTFAATTRLHLAALSLCNAAIMAIANDSGTAARALDAANAFGVWQAGLDTWPAIDTGAEQASDENGLVYADAIGAAFVRHALYNPTGSP